MTLPTSAPISIGQVAAELGLSSPLSLGDSRVLALAGKSGPPISLTDLYGKSAQAALTGSAMGSNPFYDSTSTAGTASSTAMAMAANGSGGYTYQWNVVSNTGGATVDSSSLTTNTFRASHAYSKLATGSFDVTVNCTIKDSQGNTVTTANVDAAASWDGGNR